MALSTLPNIGQTVEKKLNRLGIKTYSDLKKAGSANIYKKLKTMNPNKTLPVCYYLYSLEGAIQNRHWNDFSEVEKKKLRKKAGIEL